MMNMQPDFDKANEIYFRLGIIYKQQRKYHESLDVSKFSYWLDGLLTNDCQCFRYIVQDPPRPLSEEDIWFQIGHVHEQQKDVSDPSTDSRIMLTLSTSMRAPKLPTSVCLIEIPNTPRSCSNWAGFTIKRATPSRAKNKASSTWSSP